MKLVSAGLILVAFGGAVALSSMLFFGDRDVSSVTSDKTETENSLTLQRPTDMASYCKVLADEIQDGDTIESVEQRLGPGTPLDQEQQIRIVKAVQNWQSDAPESYPSGSLDSDVFLRWSIPDGCTLQLQFRDGRLINHAPNTYLAYLNESSND